MVHSDPRWRGLLVEPIPEMYTALRRNYRALLEAGRVETANFAVCNRTGPAPMYRVDDLIVGEKVATAQANASTKDMKTRRVGGWSDKRGISSGEVYYPGAKGDGITSSQASTLDRSLLEKHLPGQTIHTVDVQCITASRLLLRHQAGLFPSRTDRPRSLFDLLLVDAEGFDADIVDAVLDAVSIDGAGERWVSTMLPRVIRFEEKHLTTARRGALLERLRGLKYACIDIQGGDELCYLTET